MKTYSNLPIGTIVKPKKVDRYIMITSKNVEYDNCKFDYVGVFYPTGFISQNELIPFNNNVIDKLIFIGNTNYQPYKEEK